MTKPTFFATPNDFRAWLEAHHESEAELLVGFYKRHTEHPSITWPESVDEALCFGWIDGIRRRIDDQSYSIRFTPRQAKSTWSHVNIERVAELSAKGHMRAAGREAFERRVDQRSRIYAYEQHELRKSATFEERFAAEFRRDVAAWSFFDDQPPSYRSKVIWWVQSAKKPETQQRRLAKLIEASRGGERLA